MAEGLTPDRVAWAAVGLIIGIAIGWAGGQDSASPPGEPVQIAAEPGEMTDVPAPVPQPAASPSAPAPVPTTTPRQSAPAPAAPVPTPTPVRATSLPLRLVGTMIDEPGVGIAIIENTTTGRESVFGIGDGVMEGVTITSISHERVVLNRSGRQELLRIKPMRLRSPTAPPPAESG